MYQELNTRKNKQEASKEFRLKPENNFFEVLEEII